MDDWVLIDSSNPDDEGEVVVVAASAAAADDSTDGDEDNYGTGVEVLDPVPERDALSDALLLRVFPRLPACALLRFRSVSTSWNRWISSPFFVLTHSVHPRPLSGLLFHLTSGAPSYASFVPVAGGGGGEPALPDPSFSFLPEPVALVASNRGLVCARGRASGGYYVANPANCMWAALPLPAADHGDIGDAAVVIAFEEPSAFNFSADFHVVVAFPVSAGVYAFESFSSKAGAWRVAGEICASERVVAASGVAAAGRAFWRSTMGTIVCYNPVEDVREVIRPPLAVADPSTAWWELGEMEGRLCVTRVAELVAVVEVLFMAPGRADGEMVWKRAGRFGGGDLKGREEVTVLRSQSAGEVVMWDPIDRRVVAMDLHGRTKRSIDTGYGPGYCAHFIPYVSSIVEIRSHQGHAECTTSAGEAPRPAKVLKSY